MLASAVNQGKFGDINGVLIFVVTVRKFKDRHAHIEALASRFGFDFEYIFEYDAECLGSNELSQCSSELRPESASNSLKHIEAHARLLRSKFDYALVLEDDVVLFDNFFERAREALDHATSAKPGWLVFLGGADNHILPEALASRAFSLAKSPMTTAEAYLIDRVGCEKRIRWLDDNIIDCQADHLLKKIDSAVGNTQYCVTHPIATQGSITGLFRTSLDSSRAKRSSTHLQIKYFYNRFRRRVLPRVLSNVLSVRSWLK